MDIELIAFTTQGKELAWKLAQAFQADGMEAGCTRDGLGLDAWTSRAFGRSKALIFVGAAGIAVRAIAPYLQDKTRDPAVLVLDELGQFVIPILSGHLGGANDLARRIQGLTGAQPILTTATDLHGIFAVDQWARRCGLVVCTPRKIQQISSRLLQGERLGVWSRWRVEGRLPAGLVWTERERADWVVDWYAPPSSGLWISPRTLRLGIGCRRGVCEEQITQLVYQILQEEGLSLQAICGVYTIELKGKEPGLLQFCQTHHWPLHLYSAHQLRQVPGDFPSSPFVTQITGVDNVCQRAAMAEGGHLLRKKEAQQGITVALAAADPQSLHWEREG